MHGRDVDADFLEYAAPHDRHHAAAAAGALPRLALEAAGSGAGGLRLVLDRLEGGADLVPKRLEPRAGAFLASAPLVVAPVAHGGCYSPPAAGVTA